jgi:hypothetical protein
MTMRTAILTASLLLSSLASAAEPDVATPVPNPPVRNDYLFPGGGNVSLTGATGLPFAASGEVSVGIGSRFAAGAIIAAGPFPGGVVFGVNPRVDVVHVGAMRLVVDSPLLWYPALNGSDNWVLWRPMARIQGTTGRVGLYVSAGALFAKMVGASPAQGPIIPYGGSGLPSGVQQGSVWNTWGTGATFALSSRTSIFWEGFVIANGFQLAGQDWFRLPANSLLGLTTTL